MPWSSGKAGGVVLFQIVNFHSADRQHGLRDGLATCRRTASLWHGTGQCASQIVFRRHRAQTPRSPQQHSAVGAFALAGAGLLEFFASRLGGGAYEIGAQCLNFGAFIAFMGVNAAAFVHLCRNRESRNPIALSFDLSVPLLGFLICAVLWFSVSHSSMVLGGLWLVIGIAYGAVRTRGFRAELVNFDIPPDEV